MKTDTLEGDRPAAPARQPLISSISRRIILYVILCSSAITLLLTAFQLYRDYESDLSELDRKLEQIGRVHLKTVSEVLWATDSERLQTIVDGISNFRDIKYVAVMEKDRLLVSAGDARGENLNSRIYPLRYSHRGEVHDIGSLLVSVDTDAAYRRIVDRALVILIGNAIKTALVVVFMLFIFHRLLTRHLTRIARYLRRLDIDGPFEPFQLNRNDWRGEDELTVLVGSINEATQRLRLAIAEMRGAEDRFRQFGESASDWFWETDKNLRFTYFSDPYRGQSGRDIAHRIGTKREDYVTKEDLDRDRRKWDTHFADLAARRPFKNFEYVSTIHQAEHRVVRISGAPFFDKEGEFAGYRGTGTDITEIKRVEENRQNSQRLEAIGQLTGGIAHDFNNLMMTVLGNAELLSDRLQNDETASQLVGQITAAVDRGAALTKRLLAFSRQQTLSSVPSDVVRLANEIADMLRRTLGEAIDLRIEPAPELWPALIDPHQFENALLNLAINARDAMPDGGALTIEYANLALGAAGTGQLEELAAGDYVRVAVSDTGTGMTPDVLERVFEPFFTTKEMGKGSGLGLSMVFGFAKQSNGQVTITSEVGEGTTVTLYLPRSLTPAQKADTPAKTALPAAGGERILVVEDKKSVRDVPVTILRKQGYHIAEAKDGTEAIRHLTDEPPFDLLFTDIVLPGGMNGVAVAAKARKLAPGIKILYTSGYTDTSDVREETLAPGFAMIGKPYRQAELIRKVRDLLDEKEG